MSKYNPSIQTSILILVLIVTAVITPNLFQMSVILGNLRILKENLYSIHRVDCSHSTFHAQGICISYSSLVYCSPLFIWFHMVLFTILGLLRRLLEPNMFTNSSLLIQYCFLLSWLHSRKVDEHPFPCTCNQLCLISTSRPRRQPFDAPPSCDQPLYRVAGHNFLLLATCIKWNIHSIWSCSRSLSLRKDTHKFHHQVQTLDLCSSTFQNDTTRLFKMTYDLVDYNIG